MTFTTQTIQAIGDHLFEAGYSVTYLDDRTAMVLEEQRTLEVFVIDGAVSITTWRINELVFFLASHPVEDPVLFDVIEQAIRNRKSI